jgi:nitroreductase
LNAIAESRASATGAPIHELIAGRRSPRAFEDRPVEPHTLHSLLEAARWAASSMNEQPWRFIVVRREDAQDFAAAVDLLMPGNRVWAVNAPVLMFTAVSRSIARSGAPNPWARHDLGLAMGNLSLQAQALGIAVHQMGGFDAERTRTLFAIPEDFEPVTAVAIGYPGDPESLPEPFRSRETAPRIRKPLDEIAFGAHWRAPLAID